MKFIKSKLIFFNYKKEEEEEEDLETNKKSLFIYDINVTLKDRKRENIDRIIWKIRFHNDN